MFLGQLVAPKAVPVVCLASNDSILPESYRFREINVEHTGAISEPNLESPLAVSLYTWLCATHAQLARSVSSRTWLGW